MTIEKFYVIPPEFCADLTSLTLYEAYKKANKDNMYSLAIVTMDGAYRYTHRELLNMIDLASGGFTKLNISKNSRVGIMLNNTVEEAVSLLALNKIGAMSAFIDVSKSPSDIACSISKLNLQLLIIDESLLPLEPIVNKENIPYIVVNQTKPLKNGISFTELYKLGRDVEVVSVAFEKDKPSVIINSSGTTGLPKPIVHTDFSINSAAYKILCSDFSMNRENVIMKIVPSFIGLGLITTLYTSLLSGTKLVLISCSTPQQSIFNTVTFTSDFPMFRDCMCLGENAKLLMFAAPMYYKIMCDKLHCFKDLSYMGALLAAGAKIEENALELMNQKLKELNCPVGICNGYGQNEMCGAVTLNTNSANKNGSAGIPVIGTKIRIVDLETLATLECNKEGLVLEQSDSSFLCYEYLEEETEKSRITLPDGSVWFNTNDLGKMDEDGFLYITGRVTRVIVRFDCKISIDNIEQKIKVHPAVSDCAVVGVRKDEVEEIPVAFISCNESYKDSDVKMILSEIKASANSLSEMEYPEYIIVLENLPYMNNGKVDYQALQKEAEKL